MTEWDIIDWVFSQQEENNYPDAGKLWGKFRIEFAGELPSGYSVKQFKPLFDDVKNMVETPLMNAAHKLSRLERKIIKGLQELLKQVDPADSHQVRDLISAVTAFNKDRLDLETAVDDAMRELERAGVELPTELQEQINQCWPEEEKIDE